ncbi:hypothetical protein [Nostoc sp.]|uniref:hypothetical protein n=1 Tax=Nostoc sp. TaxID=1180 RepID=UPI002FF897D4
MEQNIGFELDIPEKFLLPLALRIKGKMKISEYIHFKGMKVDEIKKWISHCDSIIPGILLKEVVNFPHRVNFKN